MKDGPCENSFTGTYFQVLPDDRDSYSEIFGAGSFSMTGLKFKIRVQEAGLHTLYLRWTGGETVGGGDSLYVVLYDSDGELVPGVATLKRKMVGLLANPGQFAGACYEMTTHATPCVEMAAGMNASTVPVDCDRSQGHFWMPADPMRGDRFGVQCEAGHGELEAIPHPRWYLFAGQQYGNVMDFDSEPWDATCEAEGTGTADTGLDFPQWDLAVGDYTVAFYPREDGTAFDAFYMPTPSNHTPPNGLRLRMGASTVGPCAPHSPTSPTGDEQSRGSGSTQVTVATSQGPSGGSVFGLLLLGLLLGIALAGGCVYHRLRTGKQPLPFDLSGMSARAQTGPRLASAMTVDSSSTQYTAPQPTQSVQVRS